jgi:fumarate hydratase class II
MEHFAISGERMPAEFIQALALCKRSAAASTARSARSIRRSPMR